MKSISIIIPAFNEEEGIGAVIDEVKGVLEKHAPEHEIIVVNDGSNDRTGEIAKASGVTVIEHTVNRGYGDSIKHGLRRARHNLRKGRGGRTYE